MSLELLDLNLFLFEGGMLTLVIIAGILLVVKSVFLFLMWDRVNMKYFLNFLSYVLASVGVLIGGVFSAGLLIGSAEEEIAYIGGMLLFILPLLASAGLKTYLFIDSKWISKEE